jgi:hypothetical protein
MMQFKLVGGSIFLSVLLACGGGGSGSTSAGSPQTASGVFVDSPVTGLHYRSGSLSGETDSQGRFTYEVGQTVTFSIGGIVLPPVPGGAFVTPLSVFNAENYNDPRVINLARLLQTLDADGDPANGIAISASALSVAAGITLTDFSAADFDAQVNALVKHVGRTQLVAASDALTHLMGQSIVGTWIFENPQPNHVEVMTFLPDGHLLYGVHVLDYPGDNATGVQHASYAWNPVTGELTLSNFDINTAGDWGIWDVFNAGNRVTFVVKGPAEASVTASRNNKTSTCTRLVSRADPLFGTWVLRRPGHSMNLGEVVILPGNYYAMIAVGQKDNDGEPGFEFGTYAFVPSSGLFTASPLADTNGTWGITLDAKTPASEILIISGNTLTNTQQPDTLQRLEPTHATFWP